MFLLSGRRRQRQVITQAHGGYQTGWSEVFTDRFVLRFHRKKIIWRVRENKTTWDPYALTSVFTFWLHVFFLFQHVKTRKIFIDNNEVKWTVCRSLFPGFVGLLSSRTESTEIFYFTSEFHFFWIPNILMCNWLFFTWNTTLHAKLICVKCGPDIFQGQIQVLFKHF